MIGETLEAFVKQFQQEILHTTDSAPGGELREDAFTERMLENLRQLDEIDDPLPAPYRKPGMKVDGYSISEDGHRVDLVVSHYMGAEEPTNVPPSKLQPVARRGLGFLERSLNGLYQKIEPSTAAWDLAQRLHELRDDLDSARVIVVTDGVVRDERIQDESIGGIRVQFHVWDLERLHRALSSGRTLARTFVDFADHGGPIPVLGGRQEHGVYSTYLATVPGELLADLYEEYGSRLLERNVRSFLQRRGAVNKGIRNTILNEPEMFLTFNNGISATADDVTLTEGPNGQLHIAQVMDLQIVNGGQTTASLYHTRHRDKANLQGIQVQVKLTVVHDPDNLEDIVARISKYSNTQNKIQLSDLSSNHPFHRQVEALSRSIWAPDPEGGKRQTRWFYERARGQYHDELWKSKPGAEQTRWKLTTPTSQRFDKTDLAKFENCWHQIPHIVARGGQKSFQTFMQRVSKQEGFEPDERFFKHLVAKAILFKTIDAAAKRAGAGSYKAHINAYTLALVSHLTQQRINLDEVWDRQAVNPELADEIEALTPAVLHHVRESAGGGNVTEWTKKEECWNHLLSCSLTLGPRVQAQLLDVDAGEPQKPPTGTTASEDATVREATAQSPDFWKALAAWGKETDALTPKQRSITYSIGHYIQSGWSVSPRMARAGLTALEEARRLGYDAGGT